MKKTITILSALCLIFFSSCDYDAEVCVRDQFTNSNCEITKLPNDTRLFAIRKPDGKILVAWLPNVRHTNVNIITIFNSKEKLEK